MTYQPPSGTAKISWPNNVGGWFHGQKWWMAELNGEVYDHNTKDHLKSDLEEEGIPWVVVRRHLDGRVTVVESSTSVTGTPHSQDP